MNALTSEQAQRAEERMYRERAQRALDVIRATVPKPTSDFERHALRHKDDSHFVAALERQANEGLED